VLLFASWLACRFIAIVIRIARSSYDSFSGLIETMADSTITVTVKLFAAYQEVCGVSDLKLEFPNGTVVEAVRDRLIATHPQLAEWQEVTRFGVNLQFVPPETVLQSGDEVVLIPPVSGG
jgi:molybdopterin synthase sulfur carrier subunit